MSQKNAVGFGDEVDRQIAVGKNFDKAEADQAETGW